MLKHVIAATSLSAGLFLSAAAPSLADVYTFDPGHSEITVAWNHAGVSTQSAKFNEFSGELNLDANDPAKSAVNVVIKASSFDSGVDALDKHVKSSDFFDVEKFPEMSFKSNGVMQTGIDTADVTGELTIHGVTKPVTLTVQKMHLGEHPVGQYIDYYKGDWAGFKASTTINRSDFDVGRAAPLTSDRVTISINVEMKKK